MIRIKENKRKDRLPVEDEQGSSQNRALRRAARAQMQAHENKFNMDDMPDEVYELYKTFKFREKLFCSLYFGPQTPREICAERFGASYDGAKEMARNLERLCDPVLNWMGTRIAEITANEVCNANIITREQIIQKLAKVLMPTIEDFRDMDKARRLGYDHALKKRTIKQTKFGPEEEMEMHDPIKAAELLCKILGCIDGAGTAMPVGGAPGQAQQVNVTVNVVKSEQEK